MTIKNSSFDGLGVNKSILVINSNGSSDLKKTSWDGFWYEDHVFRHNKSWLWTSGVNKSILLKSSTRYIGLENTTEGIFGIRITNANLKNRYFGLQVNFFKNLKWFNGFEETSWGALRFRDHEYGYGKLLSWTPDGFKNYFYWPDGFDFFVLT